MGIRDSRLCYATQDSAFHLLHALQLLTINAKDSSCCLRRGPLPRSVDVFAVFERKAEGRAGADTRKCLRSGCWWLPCRNVLLSSLNSPGACHLLCGWVGKKKKLSRSFKGSLTTERRELQLCADSPGPFAKHECHPCLTHHLTVAIKVQLLPLNKNYHSQLHPVAFELFFFHLIYSDFIYTGYYVCPSVYRFVYTQCPLLINSSKCWMCPSFGSSVEELLRGWHF